uniref:Transmembrane protein n=1 Tax=Medicago truncatula TaxID=3880 RepID=I3SYM0_MEDTR|nr:unknown [Medicago truncatula]
METMTEKIKHNLLNCILELIFGKKSISLILIITLLRRSFTLLQLTL